MKISALREGESLPVFKRRLEQYHELRLIAEPLGLDAHYEPNLKFAGSCRTLATFNCMTRSVPYRRKTGIRMMRPHTDASGASSVPRKSALTSTKKLTASSLSFVKRATSPAVAK